MKRIFSLLSAPIALLFALHINKAQASCEVCLFLEARVFLEQAARVGIAKVAGEKIKFGPQAFRTHRLLRHSLEARAVAQKAPAAPQNNLHARVPARAGFEVRGQGREPYSGACRADVAVS